MTPSRDNYIKNLRFYAKLFQEHQWQTQVITCPVFVATLNEIADDFAALQQENERLRATLADPPPDVQEAVIRKLGLVSKDVLREVAEALEVLVCHYAVQGQEERSLTLKEDLRKARAALAQAEEVLK